MSGDFDGKCIVFYWNTFQIFCIFELAESIYPKFFRKQSDCEIFFFSQIRQHDDCLFFLFPNSDKKIFVVMLKDLVFPFCPVRIKARRICKEVQIIYDFVPQSDGRKVLDYSIPGCNIVGEDQRKPRTGMVSIFIITFETIYIFLHLSVAICSYQLCLSNILQYYLLFS